MLGIRRREPAAQIQDQAGSTIHADLAGAVVNGAVAIGEHIVQIHADHGAVVNYLAPEERPRPRLRAAPLRRLPRDLPDLVGRERVLSEVRRDLAPGAAPIELTGPPGIGKSAVLRHISHRVEESSVIFTACRRRPADDLLQFLFESLYECEQVFVPSPAQLAEHLQQPSAVLLLDDVEYEREELERIISLAPACTFVYASESKRLFGEGRSLPLEPLAARAGVALLERELGIGLNRKELRAVEAFCGRVGEPLRILQAADLVRRGEVTVAALGQADLGEELDESLSVPERRVLAPLRALPSAPLNAEQLSAISGVPDADHALDSLKQRGMVQACSPRFVPRLTAGARPDPGRWAARTACELAGWCERQDDPHRIGESAEAVVAVLDAGAPPIEALRLARAAEPAVMYTRRWGAWQTVLEHGLVAARESQDRAGEAWALHQLGSRALPRGEIEKARDALTAALSIRTALGDTAGAAVTAHNLDVLQGGPPPSGDGGRPAGPRRPSPSLLVAIVAAVGAIAAATLASGNDEPKPAAERPAATTSAQPAGRRAASPDRRAATSNRAATSDRRSPDGRRKVLGDQSAGSLADPDKPSVSETKDDCPGMDGCDEPPGEPEQQIDPHAQPETTQDEASSPPLKTPSNRTETPSQCLPIDEAC